MGRKEEFETIVKICERAEEMGISAGERMTLIMDLDTTNEIIGLNLEGLLAADDMNFAHDIIGIQRHINRKTKEMDDFFVPRYAKQDVEGLINKAVEESKGTGSKREAGLGRHEQDIEQ